MVHFELFKSCPQYIIIYWINVTNQFRPLSMPIAWNYFMIMRTTQLVSLSKTLKRIIITWSCYWLDQFLTLALNILILSIFYISMDLSTNYFAHFSGCWASFVCSCHYPRMLCHVFWSQVEYKIVCFISVSGMGFFCWWILNPWGNLKSCIFQWLCISQIWLLWTVQLTFRKDWKWRLWRSKPLSPKYRMLQRTIRKMPLALPERRGGWAVANARPKRG